MPLISLWRGLLSAFLLAALALPATLRAEDEIVIDCGEIAYGYPNNAATIPINTEYRVYFGCIPSPQSQWAYGVSGYADNQFGVPTVETAGVRKDIKMFPGNGSGGILGVSVSAPFTSSPKAFNTTVTMRCALTKISGTAPLGLKDTQTVTVRVRGSITYVAGAATSIPAKWAIATFSLKDGGPAAGKERLPIDFEEPEDPEEATTNVVTSYPPYTVGSDGRVYETVPPNYSIGESAGSWGTGTNWRQVTHQSGSTSWAPSGSLTFSSGGSSWTVAAAGRDFAGWTGTASQGPDGSYHIEVNGSGYGQNYGFTFPPGYKPTKIDGMPEQEPEITQDVIDPCFLAAAAEIGIPVGGGGPTDPGPTEPPDGSKEPDPISPPPLPGGPGGGGGTPPTLPPNPPPVQPPGPNAPGGSSGPSEPLPSGYTPGAPLPEDDAAAQLAAEMARKVAENSAQVQESAEGFMGWGTVANNSYGTAGGWNVSLPISGHVYTMTIPTDHAPIIRALLKLLLIAMFIIQTYKLLLR